MKAKLTLFMATACLSLSAHATELSGKLDFIRKSCTDNLQGIFALNPPGVGINVNVINIDPVHYKSHPEHVGVCMVKGEVVAGFEKTPVLYVGEVHRTTGSMRWSVSH